jgi:hypothetical protein
MSNPTTVLNPITEFSSPLVLNSISLDLKKDLDKEKYDEIEQYIKTLEIPFEIKCLIENKYIKVKNNDAIIIEYPEFLTGNTNYSFPDDLTKKQQKIIDIIKKIYPKLSDYEVVAYITLINTKCPKLLDSMLCCEKDKEKNKPVCNNFLSIFYKDNKENKENKCNYNSSVKKIKKIINKYMNKNMKIFIIGKSGVNAINKANYCITMGRFFRSDYVQINIPDFINNYYTLVKLLEFLQENTILKNLPTLANNKELLPRYQTEDNNSLLLVQNAAIYRQNSYKEYLENNNLEGTINFDPSKNQ